MFATISFCTSLAISSQPHTSILVTQHDLVLLVCIWYIIMIMLSVDSSGIFGIGGTAVLNWWWQRPTACPLIIERVWVVGSGNKQIGQAFGKVGDCIIIIYYLFLACLNTKISNVSATCSFLHIASCLWIRCYRWTVPLQYRTRLPSMLISCILFRHKNNKYYRPRPPGILI